VGERGRLWMLIALALASHIPLDALNSYGVHPFYPLDSSWYYGDAVFIFEPWLWMVLGIAAAWSSRGRSAKLAAALPILVFPVTMAWMGIIPLEALVSQAIVGVPFAWMASGMSGRARAAVALTLSMLIIGSSIATSRVAHAMAVNALGTGVRGRLVDVVLTPNPSSPLCWAVIGIELDERGGEYVLRRGTMSLAPHWKPATSCASHRFFGRRDARLIAGGHIALTDEIRQPLQRLRDLAQADCWTRAWLQFGRAPAIADDVIFDLRFAERMNQNFSRMRLKPQPAAARCAPNLTQWRVPRADLLSE